MNFNFERALTFGSNQYEAIFLVLLPLYIISIILVSNHRRNRVLSIYLLTLLSFAVPNLIMMFADFDRFINNTFLFQIFRGENTGLTHILVQSLLSLPEL